MSSDLVARDRSCGADNRAADVPKSSEPSSTIILSDFSKLLSADSSSVPLRERLKFWGTLLLLSLVAHSSIPSHCLDNESSLLLLLLLLLILLLTLFKLRDVDRRVLCCRLDRIVRRELLRVDNSAPPKREKRKARVMACHALRCGLATRIRKYLGRW